MLEVDVIKNAASTAAKTRSLRTDRVLRGTPLTPQLREAHPAVRDFDENDLIIEVIGVSPPVPGDEQPTDQVTIRANARWSGPCGNAVRHGLRLRSGNIDRETDHAAGGGQPTARVERGNIYAAPAPMSRILPGASILHIVMGAMEVFDSERAENVTWTVVAGSCATRPPPTPPPRRGPLPPAPRLPVNATNEQIREHREAFIAWRLANFGRVPTPVGPNGELRALVIVQRPLKVTFKFGFPLGDTRAGAITSTHRMSRQTSEADAVTARAQVLAVTQRTPPPLPPPGTGGAVQRGVDGATLPSTLDGGPRPSSGLAMGAVARRITFELTLNERRVDCSDRLNRFLAAKLALEEKLEQFADILKTIPRFGWGFEYEVQFFGASIEAGFERREVERPIDGRLFPVETTGVLTGTLSIIRLKCSLWIGAHFGDASSAAEIDARLIAEADGRVEAPINLRVPGGVTVSITGEIKFEVRAQVVLRVNGIGSVQARAVGATALKAKAKLYDPQDGLVLRAEAKIDRGVAYVVVGRGSFERRVFERQLWDEYEIFKIGGGSD